MRLALAALIALAACSPEGDAPGPFVTGLEPTRVSVPGTKAFTAQEIAAGVEPSAAILAAAAKSCNGARFLSATPSHSDPTKVSYFFLCP
jgi:hypothetical protein